MRRFSILVPVLLLTPTLVLAQDTPPPKPAAKAPAKSIWKKSAQRVRIRTIKAQLGDIEAKRVADDAEVIRKRAACLLAAADEVDKAAKRLDKASGDKRDDVFDDVDEANDLVDECDNGSYEEEATGEVPDGRTQISGVNVSGGKGFDNKAFTSLLSEHREEFLGCYQEALDRRTNLKGATRFSFRLGSGDNAGDVQRLRVDKDTVDDQELLECQGEVIRGMNLPEEADGKTFRFTVHHKSVKPQP